MDQDQITVPFEAGEVKVSRRSLLNRHDFICTAAELAAYVDITGPRLPKLVVAAQCEVVGYRGKAKLFWCGESLAAIARYYAPAKFKQGQKKKKHQEIENEKVGALEARRIRQLDVKIAKDEKEWVPVDVAIQAISNFESDARSVFTSCVPLMQQRFGDEVPPDVLRFVDDHLSETYNQSCEIDFNFGEVPVFENEN